MSWFVKIILWLVRIISRYDVRLIYKYELNTASRVGQWTKGALEGLCFAISKPHHSRWSNDQSGMSCLTKENETTICLTKLMFCISILSVRNDMAKVKILF